MDGGREPRRSPRQQTAAGAARGGVRVGGTVQHPFGDTAGGGGGRTSSEVVADLVPGARLVKAFNTLSPTVLGADPRTPAGRRVIFLSGNDAGANDRVGRLVERAGWAPVDLGALASGGRLRQFPGGPLPTLNLIRAA